ncbi:MAG: hypothetical protein KC519_14015, partial [Anaerolineae bacterium]|nr:hypothetical protein [Anaerolineae bacterium]
YAYLRTRDVHPATAKVCARIYAQLRHIRDIARHRQDPPMLPTFPSQRKIAELAGVGNRNTVINAVTVLQKHELLIPSVEGSRLAYKTAYRLHNVERSVSVPDGTVASASDDAMQNASPSQICQHNVPTVPEGDGGMRILVRHVEFRFTDAVKVLGTRGAAVNAIAKGRRNGYIRQTARGRYRIDRNRWAGYQVRQQFELLERKARKAHEYYIERQARIAALVIASFMSKADVVQELPIVAPDCLQARETAPTHALPLPTPNRRRRKQVVA